MLDLGLGNSIVRFIAKYRANNDKENEQKFFGVVSLYYLAVALIAVIAGIVLIVVFPFFFSTGLTPEETSLSQKLLSFTVANIAVTLLTAPYAKALIAYEKFALSRLASIFQILLKVGLTILCLKMNMGSLGIVIVHLLLTILLRSFFVFYMVGVLKLRSSLKGVTAQFVKGVVAYSSFVLLQMVATQINASVDQILIGALVANSSIILGIYGLGAQVVSYYQSMGVAFSGVIMPGVVKLCEQNREPRVLTDEMVRIGRIVLMTLGIIFVVFLVFGKQFVILWTNEANQDAYYVAAILMSAYFPIIPQAIGSQMLWATNMHKEISIIKLLIVLSNIGLTVLLIRWNPLIGGSLGTCISLLLGDCVATDIVLAKKLGISMKRLYLESMKGIIPALAVTCGAGFAFRLLGLNAWWGFLINVAFMVLVYFVCMFLFGMNKYEKGLLKSTVSKVIHRKRKGSLENG